MKTVEDVIKGIEECKILHKFLCDKVEAEADKGHEHEADAFAEAALKMGDYIDLLIKNETEGGILMDAKSQVQRMNEIKLETAEMILAAMHEAEKNTYLPERADALSKLGAALYGLQITPEPFDPSELGKMLMGGIAAPGKEEGGTVQ